jgi:hypothetical protein
MFISLGPLANRFIPDEINKNPTYILYTILLLGISALVIFLFIKKRKSNAIKKDAAHSQEPVFVLKNQAED